MIRTRNRMLQRCSVCKCLIDPNSQVLRRGSQYAHVNCCERKGMNTDLFIKQPGYDLPQG